MDKIYQRGFSLIELMIAVVLGAILLLGATQLLISSSTLGTTSNNLSANQDIARVVLDQLGSDARRAGYAGCNATGLMETANNMNKYDEELYYPIQPHPVANNLGITFRFGLPKSMVLSPYWESRLKSKDCIGNDLYAQSVTYAMCQPQNASSGGSDRPDAAATKGICVYEAGGFLNQGDLDTALNFAKSGSFGASRFNNVTLNKIVFLIPTKTELGQERYDEVSIGGDDPTYTQVMTVEQLKKIMTAETVTFYITVTTNTAEQNAETATTVSRQYSGTYKLRNL